MQWRHLLFQLDFCLILLVGVDKSQEGDHSSWPCFSNSFWNFWSKTKRNAVQLPLQHSLNILHWKSKTWSHDISPQRLNTKNIEKIVVFAQLENIWYSSFDEVTVLETHVVYYFDVLEIWIFFAHDPTEKRRGKSENLLKDDWNFFCILHHQDFVYTQGIHTYFWARGGKEKKEIFYINTKHLNRRKLN